MSEFNGTPAPWLFGQDGFNLGNGVVYARHSNGNPKDICHLHGWGADKQANAKLIAAAPDLLAALQAFERIVDIWLPAEVEEQHGEELYALHQARNDMLAALAKATT